MYSHDHLLGFVRVPHGAGCGPIDQPLDDYYRILLIYNEMNYAHVYDAFFSYMSQLWSRYDGLRVIWGQRKTPRSGEVGDRMGTCGYWPPLYAPNRYMATIRRKIGHL